MTRIAPEHSTKPRKPKEKEKKKKLRRQNAKRNLMGGKKVHPRDVIVGHNDTKMKSILKQSRLKEKVSAKFQEAGKRHFLKRVIQLGKGKGSTSSAAASTGT